MSTVIVRIAQQLQPTCGTNLFRFYGKMPRCSMDTSKMEELSSPSVRMKNRPVVEEKLKNLMKGGIKQLQVISDFDFTLSRSHIDGKRCTSCHGSINLSERMPAAFREATGRYKEHYLPIVADPNRPLKEKSDSTAEWWVKWFDLLYETGLKQSELTKIISESNIILRDECADFLDLLHRHQVPLVIFSAGIGNILEEAIRQQSCLFDNIKVIANYLQFGEDGRVKGLRNSTIIHIYNKSSDAIDVGDTFSNSTSRPNVLLLGDSLGDANMDAGLSNIDTVLRVGFLNGELDVSLPRFMDNYDIVILNDQSLRVVNNLVQRILS